MAGKALPVGNGSGPVASRPLDTARAAVASTPLSGGRCEDGLFRFDVTPEGETMRVKIDLIDTLGFVPAGPSEYIAEKFPATLRIRLQADGSGDHFEFD